MLRPQALMLPVDPANDAYKPSQPHTRSTTAITAPPAILYNAPACGGPTALFLTRVSKLAALQALRRVSVTVPPRLTHVSVYAGNRLTLLVHTLPVFREKRKIAAPRTFIKLH